ncbi:MAG: hypothetical protein IKL29_07900 [Bacteroidaceae bacterium]|nr:hypothetical protein [Bacteroidaceae bacterium]
MKNYFRRPCIFEISTAYEDGRNGVIEQKEKPKTNVVINSTRRWYGKNSTVSTFTATAYNEQGEKIDSMQGYFLEPHVNYDSAKIAKSDKAIMYGTYNVISKAELEKRINVQQKARGEEEVNLRFDWYVDDVPGRSGIAIHGGKNGDHTSGCLLPGDTLEYNEQAKDYTINNSQSKKNELFNFFKQYGENGIKINIGFK